MSKLIDLTGQKFNHWTVLERAENNARGGSRWKCQCDCENHTIKIVDGWTLRSGKTLSCGCEHKKRASEANLDDIKGQHFGHLTVLERAGVDKNRKVLWKCQCDCDAKTIIIIRGSDLKTGKTISCGCIKSKGEEKIAKLLKENNIPFEKEKVFSDCVYPETNGKLRFDFYVNEKYLIEFDGIQHYDRSNPWYKNNAEKDNFKTKWCKEHNIPLIRISYQQLNNLTIEDIIL